MSLGRPISVSDRDIDVELPFDVDCVQANPVLGPSSGYTSMTSSLHVVQMCVQRSIPLVPSAL